MGRTGSIHSSVVPQNDQGIQRSVSGDVRTTWVESAPTQPERNGAFILSYEWKRDFPRRVLK
ncbi:hypothetical protein KSB_75190 [Ktedonobacter robiniae]|uniref:Uncharacterized protein n=1 Tax=Ktedonobacter robiniae TaxID=2778365 RepID=A0ABQ3V1L8_9CHLR|nr:hypothetical protein KSB_75190 [Ktedonobacter robiniae]